MPNHAKNYWQRRGIEYARPPVETPPIATEPVAPPRELAVAFSLEIPSRWALVDNKSMPRNQVIAYIEELASTTAKGVEALQGLYMRMCDTIRESRLTDEDATSALSKHFPEPRVMEILTVCHASEEVYTQYRSSFFSFRTRLKQCRLYHVTPTKQLKQRQIARASRRVVELLGEPTKFSIDGWTIILERGEEAPKLNIPETSPLPDFTPGHAYTDKQKVALRVWLANPTKTMKQVAQEAGVSIGTVNSVVQMEKALSVGRERRKA